MSYLCYRTSVLFFNTRVSLVLSLVCPLWCHFHTAGFLRQAWYHWIKCPAMGSTGLGIMSGVSGLCALSGITCDADRLIGV